jgi:hypothetical protein
VLQEAGLFTGKTEERHATSDFESASRSSAVECKTRKLLAAMVAPHGALPADEVRKLVAKLHQPLPTSAPTTVPELPPPKSRGLRARPDIPDGHV